MPVSEAKYNLDFGTEDGSLTGALHPHKVDLSGDLHTKDTNAGALLTALASLSTDIKALVNTVSGQLTTLSGLSSDIKALSTQLSGQLPASLGQKNMAGSLSVTVASNQPSLVSKISGTEDGTASGTERVFVNNLKNQILAAKDRAQSLTYADFGTKDQRITRIDYAAPSIGSGAGFTARKTISYTLIGNSYRRDTITWSII